MHISLLYITFPDESSGRSVAGFLLEHKLVACANFFPASSMYWWKGDLQNDQEWIGIFKTRCDLVEKVKKNVSANHPYEIPCLLSFDAEVNEAYGNWVFEQTSG